MAFLDPPLVARIGVATARGRPYYRFSSRLKQLGIPFDSILPSDIPLYRGDLVLTTRDEFPSGCAKPAVYEDAFGLHPTVTCGMMVQMLAPRAGGDLVLGVDPGKRLGLSVLYYNREIGCSFFSSAHGLVSHMIMVLGGLRARRKVVKIGNGAMPIARQVASLLNLRFCSSFELEYVDEHRTSPRIKNYNQGGKRDMLAARYISQREGYRYMVQPLSITG